MPLRHKTFFLFWVALQFIILVSLFMGASWLVYPLSEELQLPAGTLATWFLLIAFPLNFYWLSGRQKKRGVVVNIVRGVFLTAVLLGAAWGLVSYYLSGNWGFNFVHQPGESRIFWTYLKVTGGVSLAGLVLWGVVAVWQRSQEN